MRDRLVRVWRQPITQVVVYGLPIFCVFNFFYAFMERLNSL
jgi:hypothetical protein